MSKIQVFVHFKEIEKRERVIIHDEGWLKWCESIIHTIAMWNMRYKHVEVALKISDVRRLGYSDLVPVTALPTQHLAITVYRKHNVSVYPRDYGNVLYETLTLSCSEDQVRDMLDFVQKEKDKLYGQSPLEIVIWPSRSDDGFYFCTKFVVRLLQQLGYFRGCSPSDFFADDIYRGLQAQSYSKTAFVLPSDQNYLRGGNSAGKTYNFLK